MSGIFKLLGSLISGIAAFFGGLLGSKKADSAPSLAPKAKKSSGYFLELDEAKGLGTAAPAPVEKAAEPVAAQPVVAPPAAKTEAAPKPAPAAPKTAPAPEPVAVANTLNLPKPSVATFAPDYLAPSAGSNGRRRPGANMSSFLDMARQVKVPG